jgi:hypothetical protein
MLDDRMTGLERRLTHLEAEVLHEMRGAVRSDTELIILINAVKRTAKVPGDLREIVAQIQQELMGSRLINREFPDMESPSE